MNVLIEKLVAAAGAVAKAVSRQGKTRACDADVAFATNVGIDVGRWETADGNEQGRQTSVAVPMASSGRLG